MNTNDVINRLKAVSQYFKSMLKVGCDGDAETYTKHRESVKMAIELIIAIEAKIFEMKMIYGDYGEIVGELVRCKDCKFGTENTSWCGELRIKCKYPYTQICYHLPDWYCADGVKRD